MPREAEWESRWWSPIINAEHLAMRDGCGLVDLSAFVDLRRHRSRAPCPPCSASPSRRWTSPSDGSSTPPCSTSGAASSPTSRSCASARRPLPGRDRRGDGHDREEVVPRPPARGRLGAAHRPHLCLDDVRPLGARARDVLQACTDDDVSHAGFRSGRAARSSSAASGRSPRASRMSASSAGSSTCRSRRAPVPGTRSGRPASSTASSRSASASTARPAGSRRDTAPSATS